MHLSLVGSTKQMSDFQNSKKCSDGHKTLHEVIFCLEKAQCPMSQHQVQNCGQESDFIWLEPAYLTPSSQLALNLRLKIF